MGGKWRIAPAIIRYLPAHRLYVEPFGGGASVLLRKARSYAEVYNDLDGEIVSFFRVLRDRTSAAELGRLLTLTPFARAEFEAAYEVSDDPIEAARRLLIRSFMGHGSTSIALRRRTGFRAAIHKRRGTTASDDWASLPESLALIHERLQRVAIENRSAKSIIERFDAPDALLYVDPPYLPETRSQKHIRGALEHAYKHELTPADHVELLAQLKSCSGMVLVSGYASDLYDQMLADWQRVQLPAYADGGRARTEVLWINPAALAAHGLFKVEP